MPVDVDARDGGEQHGRHEERQDQQADRGVRAGSRTMMTVRPNRTMLPPICVAAWRSQRRRNGAVAEDREARRAPDPPAVRLERLGVERHPGVGHVARSQRIRARRAGGDGGGDRRVAALHEAGEPALERRALDRGRGDRRSGSAARCRHRADRRARCRRRRDASAAADDVAEQQGRGRVGPARRDRVS